MQTSDRRAGSLPPGIPPDAVYVSDVENKINGDYIQRYESPTGIYLSIRAANVIAANDWYWTAVGTRDRRDMRPIHAFAAAR